MLCEDAGPVNALMTTGRATFAAAGQGRRGERGAQPLGQRLCEVVAHRGMLGAVPYSCYSPPSPVGSEVYCSASFLAQTKKER
jgi:hypothetical protein